MKWRVVLELIGADGTAAIHAVSGGAVVAEYAPRMIGLTLAEGKLMLAAVQRHLVQAQTKDHCRLRRCCQRCGVRRPLKDVRSRRLISLFGTVRVRAPRFTPCRCAVTCRGTLSPVAEIMPDRRTPEYEQIVAKMGAVLLLLCHNLSRAITALAAGAARQLACEGSGNGNADGGDGGFHMAFRPHRQIRGAGNLRVPELP